MAAWHTSTSPSPSPSLPEPSPSQQQREMAELIAAALRAHPSRRRRDEDVEDTAGNGGGGGRRGGGGGGGGYDLDTPPPELLAARKPFSDRIEHFTWAWFSMTMATGSLANAIDAVPFESRGVHLLGLSIFSLNVALFLFNVCMLCTRFLRFPGTLQASLLHPTECLFVGAALLSIATIFTGILGYTSATSTWFSVAARALFWGYVVAALGFTVGIHLVMWTTQTHTVAHMTPAWILPAYPLLLVGPLAAAVVPRVPLSAATLILLAGLACQGIGFLLALMIYSAYIARLMTAKLPKPRARPGMFISVGPSGFTAAALIRLAAAIPHSSSSSSQSSQSQSQSQAVQGQQDALVTARVLELLALTAAVALWGLALWFFLISVAANLLAVSRRNMHYTLGWWAWVFPNSAICLATFAIGSTLDSRALNVAGCVATAAVAGMWAFVLVMTVRGVIKGEIMGGTRDEDREEGGFVNSRRRDRPFPGRSFTQ